LNNLETKKKVIVMTNLMYPFAYSKSIQKIFICLLILCLFGNCSANSEKEKLNVLFIFCDDLNDSVEGMGGHVQAKTPNLNRLVEAGIQFTNAHSNNPVCGPSRASLWTGIHPATSGYYGANQNRNTWRHNAILKDAVTVFEHFHANGYNVLGTGKIFHNNQQTKELFKLQNDSIEFGYGQSYGPFPWDGINNSISRTPHPKMQVKNWGKDGNETDLPLSEVPDVKPDPEKGIPGYKGWRDMNRPFKYNSETDRDLMVDEKSAAWVIERLNRDFDGPFFMAVGIIRPHTPFVAPKKYFDMFPIEDIELPPYLENDLDDCGEFIKEMKRKSSWYTRFERIREAFGDTLGWKMSVQSYLACVAFADAQVGKILDTLEKSKYADNTVVVFSSDHGIHMGEKDMLIKKTPWEESTRVPLIIKVPGNKVQNKKCDHPISLIDVYPTLVDICGLPEQPNLNTNNYNLDGNSLVPFLRNPVNGEWTGNNYVISCIEGNEPVEIGEQGKIEDQNFTIRTKKWRYILYKNGDEELYDHDKDPQEWHNVADDAEFAVIKKELKETLLGAIKN